MSAPSGRTCTILARGRCRLPGEAAPAGVAAADICLPPPELTVARTFACRETRGKSAHFRGGCCHDPYPPHYRAAFAYSPIPYPLPHRRHLRDAYPEGRQRAYHVPPMYREKIRSRLCAGGAASACGQFGRPQPVPVPFWPRPVSPFGLSSLTALGGASPGLTVLLDPSSRPP